MLLPFAEVNPEEFTPYPAQFWAEINTGALQLRKIVVRGQVVDQGKGSSFCAFWIKQAPQAENWNGAVRSVRPFLGGPISGGVDHPDNCHGFLTACLRDRIGQNVGQTCHRFLIGARHSSWASYRHVPEGQGRSVDSIGHAAGS